MRGHPQDNRRQPGYRSCLDIICGARNLSVRMHTRRFTRLTNGFSKKVENHAHSVALFAMYYNYVRIHKTLRTTPAMAAKVTERLWEIGDIVDVFEAWESRTTLNEVPHEESLRVPPACRRMPNVGAAGECGRTSPNAAQHGGHLGNACGKPRAHLGQQGQAGRLISGNPARNLELATYVTRATLQCGRGVAGTTSGSASGSSGRRVGGL